MVCATGLPHTATRDRFMQEKSSTPWRKGSAATAVSATAGLVDHAQQARSAGAAQSTVSGVNGVNGPISPNTVSAADALHGRPHQALTINLPSACRLRIARAAVHAGARSAPSVR